MVPPLTRVDEQGWGHSTSEMKNAQHWMFLKPPPFSPKDTAQEGSASGAHPWGPVSSEVTKVQRAHWELLSLECSWGREVLSMPQDVPSTGTPPPSLALCAVPPVTLWVSEREPQTTDPVHPSGVQSWAGGSRRSPNPQTLQQP